MESLKRRGRLLASGKSGVYHVLNRVALSSMLLNGEAKAVFLRMMRRQAAFAGVEVLAHCVMTNHFHVLVRVPKTVELSDDELLRRYRLLYGVDRPHSAPDPEVLALLFKQGGNIAGLWRKRLHARMHLLSPFIAELKQRFSIWFNDHHNNKGTVWSERFKSVLVQDLPEFVAPAAAYIDLNPVRAGIVSDPGEYAYSSYGSAMQGSAIARRGLSLIYYKENRWNVAFAAYRVLLFGKGAESCWLGKENSGMLDAERAYAVIREGGRLTWAEYLRMRVGYFSRGRALGSESFIQTLKLDKKLFPRQHTSSGAKPITGVMNPVFSLKNLQQFPIG